MAQKTPKELVDQAVAAVDTMIHTRLTQAQHLPGRITEDERLNYNRTYQTATSNLAESLEGLYTLATSPLAAFDVAADAPASSETKGTKE